MKKLLGLLMVLALALPASADVLNNVELKGEIQTIASGVKHNRANLYNQDVNNRVLAGLSAELVEDVKANVLFQYTNIWDGDMNGDNINAYEARIRLSEANVVLSNLFDCFEATIGRQFYGDENSAVMYIGPNHYNGEMNFAPSLDAVKVTYSDDAKALTLIAGKLSDRADLLDDDISVTGSLFGADFHMNLSEALTAQVYGYDVAHTQVWDTSVTPWTLLAEDEEFRHMGFWGAKVAFNPEAFLFSAEYARNFNGRSLFKESHKNGYMVKADAAMNVEAATVRGTFLYANGNFFAMGNYTPGLLVGHYLGGDIWDYSEGGIRMFNVGFDYNLTTTWALALDGYIFQDRTAKTTETYEADLNVKYTHNEYVQLFAGVGYAKYGNDATSDFNKAALGAEDIKGQLGMLINF